MNGFVAGRKPIRGKDSAAPTTTPAANAGQSITRKSKRLWRDEGLPTAGRPVEIVSIVDEHTRECLDGLVERSITADRLIDELDRIAVDRGYPATLRCDNGSEFACQAMAGPSLRRDQRLEGRI